MWVRLLNGLYVVQLLMVPVTIVIGIVRHRLFDIDPVVRRSTSFAALSLVIAGRLHRADRRARADPAATQIPVEVAVRA